MCKFCREWHGKNTICGSEIKVNQYDNNILSSLVNAQILKNTGDKKAGIILFSSGSIPVGYFDIDYCPMCGKEFERFMRNEQ